MFVWRFLPCFVSHNVRDRQFETLSSSGKSFSWTHTGAKSIPASLSLSTTILFSQEDTVHSLPRTMSLHSLMCQLRAHREGFCGLQFGPAPCGPLWIIGFFKRPPKLHTRHHAAYMRSTRLHYTWHICTYMRTIRPHVINVTPRGNDRLHYMCMPLTCWLLQALKFWPHPPPISNNVFGGLTLHSRPFSY